MAKLLSFPFRVATYGAAVSNDQGTDQYYKEQIATIVLTRRGERILSDDLGMPDIVYSGFLYSAFKAQVAEKLPEIVELTATIKDTSDTTEDVIIEFSVTEENR
jgi:hypothetical protein